MASSSRTTRRVAVIQARLGSSRLPGKVLEQLGGVSILEWVVRRVRAASRLTDVIVATTTRDLDDKIASLCTTLNVGCFRGAEHDVLDRFVQAARWAKATDIVRVNADNPLIDPQYIDALVAESANCEYISYQTSDGRPVMLTALSFFSELISVECLERAAAEISDAHLREHVTLGIYRNPDRFRVRFLPVPAFAENNRLRFTVDTSMDLELIREIVEDLGENGICMSGESIVKHITRRDDWLARMDELNRRNVKT